MKFFNSKKGKTPKEEKIMPKQNGLVAQPKEEIRSREEQKQAPKFTAKQENVGTAGTTTQNFASAGKEITPPPLFGEEKKKSSFWSTEPDSWKKTYKPTINKRLTILLIENTQKVQEQSANLAKIVNGIVTTGLVCIIRYGSFVRQSDIIEASNIKDVQLLCLDDIGEKACLFDALLEVERLVSQKYMRSEEKEKEKVFINQIEVIGIGTCQDNGSKVIKDLGIGCFSKVVVKPNVVTKYFCLTDESFIHAAEVGFRSIGSISRNYQS